MRKLSKTLLSLLLIAAMLWLADIEELDRSWKC